MAGWVTLVGAGATEEMAAHGGYHQMSFSYSTHVLLHEHGELLFDWLSQIALLSKSVSK